MATFNRIWTRRPTEKQKTLLHSASIQRTSRKITVQRHRNTVILHNLMIEALDERLLPLLQSAACQDIKIDRLRMLLEHGRQP